MPSTIMPPQPIWTLRAQHHAVFKFDILLRRTERRKFMYVDVDPVPAIASFVFGQRALADAIERVSEQFADAHNRAR